MSQTLNIQMLEKVAEALGDDLLTEMVFVGGCTTGLLVTDEVTREDIRHTNDVDLIVSVNSYTGFNALAEKLIQKGFVRPGLEHDAPTCALFLGSLRVDFMPDDEEALGFTNRWYQTALEHADVYPLPNGTNIKVVSPVYFVATKLEAYNGRGKNDPLGSQDVEDLVNLIDGRDALCTELAGANDDVKQYIAEQVETLAQNADFEWVVKSHCNSSAGREDIIFERIEAIIRLAE